MSVTEVKILNPAVKSYNFSKPAAKSNNQVLTKSSVTYSLWGVQNNKTAQFRPAFGVHLPDVRRLQSSNFKISKVEDLPCPSCGNIMMPKAQVSRFRSAVLTKVPEQSCVKFLLKYEKYMAPVEHEVFREIKSLSKKYPEKLLNELVSELREVKIGQLENVQLKKISVMKEMAKTLNKREKEDVDSLLDFSASIITSRSNVNPFRRKRFLTNIEELNLSDDKVKKQLVRVANSFPSSHEAESAWIVKYSGTDKNGEKWSSKAITERFLSGSSTNTDHMLAQDLDGQNLISNYLSMHSACNTAKTNKTFMEWFNEAPEERAKNIKTYLRAVQNKIDSGAITESRYQNYPSEAVETIKKLSNGELDFSDY